MNNQILTWDGHSHTQMCRHGSLQPTEKHVLKAIEKGFKTLSVTEHAPLPDGYLKDQKMQHIISLKEEELDEYFKHLENLKQRYSPDITILQGFEFDYLPGRADETKRQVESYEWEDAVISIHFLCVDGVNEPIDFTPESFSSGVKNHFGSIFETHMHYWREYKKMAELCADLKKSPKLGHPFLINKFIQNFPLTTQESVDLENYVIHEILPILVKGKLKVDFNFSGIDVPTCKQPYVTNTVAIECMKLDIPLIYGSDSHSPDHIGRYHKNYLNFIAAHSSES